MKESYPKYIVNAVVIVLVAIIIAVTFTLNYSSVDKNRADCYEKVYSGYLALYTTSESWKKQLKTKKEAEGKAAGVAARKCFE
jgi:hypothetical protein